MKKASDIGGHTQATRSALRDNTGKGNEKKGFSDRDAAGGNNLKSEKQNASSAKRERLKIEHPQGNQP